MLQAICLIHYHKPQEPVPMPENEDELTDEQRDKINEQNEEIEKSNELYTKLKQFIKLQTPNEEDPSTALPDYEAANEKCIVRLQNYREPVNPDLTEGQAAALNTSALSKDHHVSRTSAAQAADADQNSKMDTVSETSSQRAIKAIEAFEVEKLAQKVILMRPAHEAYEGNALVQHSEAVYMVRKAILEKAKNHWKEAKDVSTNYLLGMTGRTQKQLDTKFEEHCIKELGYELGEQYEDQNMRVTFKTFLKAEDPRLEE